MLETGVNRMLRGRSQTSTAAPTPLKKVKRETESVSNGFIRVSPAVVRFAGFKIGTEVHRKFTVFAESIHPLRMTLSGDLPAEFFMDMSKKGKIAAGLSQEVSILFTPKSTETHRFSVTVATELGTLTIPVEAYQVMNPDVIKEFGSTMDLGVSCLGKTKSIFRKIENFSERSFDFEFNVATFPSEFKVVPHKGVVEPGQTVEVELRFEPVEAKHVSVQVQFNFIPIDFTLQGQGSLKEEEIPKASGNLPTNGSVLKKAKEEKVQAVSTKSLKTKNQKLEPMPDKIPTETIDAAKKVIPGSAKTVKKKMLRAIVRPEVTPLHITQQKNIVQDAFTQEFGTISLESQKRKVKIFPWRGEPGLTAEEIDQQISNRKSALEGFDNSTWEAVYSRYQGIENVSLPVYSNSIISVLRKKSEKSEVVEAPLSFLERFKRGVCQVVQLNRLKKRVKAAREEKLHPKPPQQTSRLIKTGFRLSEAPGDAFQQLLADLSPESCANEASTIESDSCNRLISVNVVVGPIEITDDLLPLNTIPCDFLSIHQYCEYMEFNPREIFLAAGPPHTSRTGFTVEGLGIPEFAAAEPAGNDRRGSVFTTNLGIRPAPI